MLSVRAHFEDWLSAQGAFSSVAEVLSGDLEAISRSSGISETVLRGLREECGFCTLAFARILQEKPEINLVDLRDLAQQHTQAPLGSTDWRVYWGAVFALSKIRGGSRYLPILRCNGPGGSNDHDDHGTRSEKVSG